MILKGAIDNIHPHKIGGWIYSDTKNVRGIEVQAFVGTDCVGAGRVDIFRQDLADAGLGDGYLGFSFPISLKSTLDLGCVVVKISESDFFLLPAQANVHTPNRFSAYANQLHSQSSIEYMRKKGWLTNSELNFLKFVNDLGVFDVSLVRPKVEQKNGMGHLLEPGDLAAEYLSLMSLAEVGVNEIELHDPAAEDVAASVGRTALKPFPLVGLLASKPCHVELIEGSHKDEAKTKSLVGSVQHIMGPDRILFVNLLCSFAFNFPDAQVALRIFSLKENK